MNWKRVEGSRRHNEFRHRTTWCHAPHRLMDLFENWHCLSESRGDVVKLLAKTAVHGVNKVLKNDKNIEELKGKLGVYWHTLMESLFMVSV